MPTANHLRMAGARKSSICIVASRPTTVVVVGLMEQFSSHRRFLIMAKFSREHKMISADGNTKLRVYAKEGKRGINVGVTIKDPGVKARTGCQDTFENADAALNRFNALVKQGEDLGWMPRGESPAANGRRSAFSQIPASPGSEQAQATASEEVEGTIEVEGPESEESEDEEVAAGSAPTSNRRRNRK